MAGLLRRLALVLSIPLLLWGGLETTGLLKAQAPGVPQELTNHTRIPAQPESADPVCQSADAIQEPPETQITTQAYVPASRRPVLRMPVQASLSQVMEMEAAIQKYSRAYGVDENLVWAVVRRESGFNPTAVSPKGAMGLMQLMPGTAASMGVTDPFDVEQNIAGGIKYLVICLKQFNGDIGLALAAYNAGPDNVVKFQGSPPFVETTHYVAAVLQDYAGPPRARIFTVRPPEPNLPKGITTTIEASGLHWNLPLPAVKTPKPTWRIAEPRWKVFQVKEQARAEKSSTPIPAFR